MQDDGTSMFVLSYSQNGSRFTVSCCREFMSSESGILFCLWHGNPTSRHKGQKPRELNAAEHPKPGNQKKNRCLAQGNKKTSRCGRPDGPPKQHVGNSLWLALPLQIWGVTGGLLRCGGRPQDRQTQGRECDILSAESMFFSVHMVVVRVNASQCSKLFPLCNRYQMDLTWPILSLEVQPSDSGGLVTALKGKELHASHLPANSNF